MIFVLSLTLSARDRDESESLLDVISWGNGIWSGLPNKELFSVFVDDVLSFRSLFLIYYIFVVE